MRYVHSRNEAEGANPRGKNAISGGMPQRIVCQCFVSGHVAKEKLSEIFLEGKKNKNLLFYTNNFRLRARLYAPSAIHSPVRDNRRADERATFTRYRRDGGFVQ